MKFQKVVKASLINELEEKIDDIVENTDHKLYYILNRAKYRMQGNTIKPQQLDQLIEKCDELDSIIYKMYKEMWSIIEQ